MKAATRAAELDKAAAVVARLGFRPSAWSDGSVIVDHMFDDGDMFAVWAVDAGAEERVDAAGLPGAVSRARAASRSQKKAARRG